MIKKGLGKGLGALLDTENSELQSGVTEIRVNDIEPNRFQPRKVFNDDKLIQLSESIKKHGVVQPIIVNKENDTYVIVAGERRWRATRLAGLKTIPAIIKDITKKQVMEIALIENLQREDLNPLEEAEAYDKLVKEYNMTQEDISSSVGKSRPAIANSLRLLALGEKVKSYLVSGEISSGHARALITLEEEQQLKVVEEIISKGLNVRATEELVKKYLNPKKKKEEKKFNVEINALEEMFTGIFGTKVKLMSNNNKGKIMIEYYSNDELDRIINLLDKIPKKNEAL